MVDAKKKEGHVMRNAKIDGPCGPLAGLNRRARRARSLIPTIYFLFFVELERK